MAETRSCGMRSWSLQDWEWGKKNNLSVFTSTTLAWKEGQPWWAGEEGKWGLGGRGGEQQGQWNILVRADLMGEMMNAEGLFVTILMGEDDSFLVVPWSLLSPEQMIFIKGWTAGVWFPRLKSWSENKTWERAKRFKGLTHLLLQNCNLPQHQPFWGVQHPEHSFGGLAMKTDFSCVVYFKQKKKKKVSMNFKNFKFWRILQRGGGQEWIRRHGISFSRVQLCVAPFTSPH